MVAAIAARNFVVWAGRLCPLKLKDSTNVKHENHLYKIE